MRLRGRMGRIGDGLVAVDDPCLAKVVGGHLDLDAVAHREGRSLPHRHHVAHGLVPQHHGCLCVLVPRHQVGAADAAGQGFHQYLALRRLGLHRSSLADLRSAGLLLGLLAAHVAAAFKHHWIDGDDILKRMLPFGSARDKDRP